MRAVTQSLRSRFSYGYFALIVCFAFCCQGSFSFNLRRGLSGDDDDYSNSHAYRMTHNSTNDPIVISVVGVVCTLAIVGIAFMDNKFGNIH